jgi:DNA polymerase I-like protein with 3'-5' exonuclease and polymerase domains
MGIIPMIISLDTETTGLDLRHGARPFLVTICDEEGINVWWEWGVDPLTRKVNVAREELLAIQALINRSDLLILQNAKFDFVGLDLLFKDHGLRLQWDWKKVRDTLLAGHLLRSNQAHDLTTMTLVYCGVNVQPYEDRVREATNEARRIARAEHPDWQLASPDLPKMPSIKGTPWKNDMWLPRLLARERGYADDHPWQTVCSDYANSDSASTMAVWRAQEKLLRKKGLWRIYEERLKVLPVVTAVEAAGITVNRTRLEELRGAYRDESEKAGRICLNIARGYGYDLELPKSGNNNSMTGFLLGLLGLKSSRKSKKTAKPSLDKSVLEHWEATLPEKSQALTFVRALRGKRKRDTGLSYLEGYEKFWLPLVHRDIGRPQGLTSPAVGGKPTSGVRSVGQWFILHPSLNPTGTDTLRWSSSNPNEQNISNQEGFNLRYCFGPAPGREWWSLDAKNIELRIPAYESGEEAMIRVFDHPKEPPYFGSYHLLIADLLHPGKFREYGVKFKDVFEATWYKWIKNGNFAVIYGAQEATADRAYRVPGAYDRIRRRFPKIAGLSDQQIALATRRGYVETMPDRTVDSERGYPLWCRRTNHGRILPTIPLNYHVQGTACWWMMKAMIRCHVQLEEWRCAGFDGRMVMQVHDELVFDFPKGSKVVTGEGVGYKNLWRVKKIKRLMEQGGDNIGVPTPVSVTYHANHWGTGEGVL